MDLNRDPSKPTKHFPLFQPARRPHIFIQLPACQPNDRDLPFKARRPPSLCEGVSRSCHCLSSHPIAVWKREGNPSAHINVSSIPNRHSTSPGPPPSSSLLAARCIWNMSMENFSAIWLRRSSPGMPTLEALFLLVDMDWSTLRLKRRLYTRWRGLPKM